MFSSILRLPAESPTFCLTLDMLYAGETLQGKSDTGFVLPGGKGANQAVAAARTAVATGVKFCGNFGNDNHADMLKASLSGSSMHPHYEAWFLPSRKTRQKHRLSSGSRAQPHFEKCDIWTGSRSYDMSMYCIAFHCLLEVIFKPTSSIYDTSSFFLSCPRLTYCCKREDRIQSY